MLSISAFQHLPPAQAQPSSEHFVIEQGTITLDAAENRFNDTQLEKLMGKTDAAVFKRKGVVIQSGEKDELSTALFTSAVSPASIEYGHIRPGDRGMKDIHITIDPGMVHSYQIFIGQDHPLKSASGGTIRDTVCDSPSQPCTMTVASPWIRTTTYGTGYRLTGLGTLSDFETGSAYRPLSSWMNNEPLSLIATTRMATTPQHLGLTLRSYVPPDQPEGLYTHSIQIRVLPVI